MKNVEIEIKVQIEESAFEKFRSFLLKNAKLKKESYQTDEYFTPVHRDFLSPDYPFEWLSIRERNKKVILNYKHWYPENEEKSTHCDEYEVELSSYENMNKIFQSLNIKSLVKVVKKREIYNYNDEFEIALDKVEELGYFIEIEVKKEFESIEIANKRLLEFAGQIGVDTTNRNYRGYPFLLLEKYGLFKK
jgi:predicted adenylyl cyclase CyaB